MPGAGLDEARRAVDRDAARVKEPRNRTSLLRAMALIGSVGWPIAVLTAGGAILGHWIDERIGGGVAATLVLLMAGAIGGSLLAARSLRERDGR